MSSLVLHNLSDNWQSIIEAIDNHTVETLYNTINFCWSTHKRHSIARPKGRGMGCLLWVQRATYCVDLSILSFINICYNKSCYKGSPLYFSIHKDLHLTVFALSAGPRPSATKNWAGPASFPFGTASFSSFSCLKIFKDEFRAGKFWNLNAKTAWL